MCLTLHQLLNVQNQGNRPSESDIKLGAPSPPEACHQGAPQAAEGSAQLQLPQHRGQTRRNLGGRDSRGGSGTLCSSSSTVTSLQEFAGDKLCRFPELSPRSDTAQPSSSTATRTPILATASSPGEAKDRLLGDFPPHLSGGLQELGGRCGGVLGAGDSLTLQGRRRTGLGSPIKMSSACTAIPGRRDMVYCLPHGKVTSCSRTSGLLT